MAWKSVMNLVKSDARFYEDTDENDEPKPAGWQFLQADDEILGDEDDGDEDYSAADDEESDEDSDDQKDDDVDDSDASEDEDDEADALDWDYDS